MLPPGLSGGPRSRAPLWRRVENTAGRSSSPPRSPSDRQLVTRKQHGVMGAFAGGGAGETTGSILLVFSLGSSVAGAPDRARAQARRLFRREPPPTELLAFWSWWRGSPAGRLGPRRCGCRPPLLRRAPGRDGQLAIAVRRAPGRVGQADIANPGPRHGLRTVRTGFRGPGKHLCHLRNAFRGPWKAMANWQLRSRGLRDAWANWQLGSGGLRDAWASGRPTVRVSSPPCRRRCGAQACSRRTSSTAHR